MKTLIASQIQMKNRVNQTIALQRLAHLPLGEHHS